MTGDQSRQLNVGDRVYWSADKNDLGTVTEKNWAGLTVSSNRTRRPEARSPPHARFGHVSPADSSKQQRMLSAEVGHPPGVGGKYADVSALLKG
jgi:hypothetical protein